MASIACISVMEERERGMFVVCLCIFKRCSAFSYEQDMIIIQFFCSYNNVQFLKTFFFPKDFVNLLSEMWVTLCTLTWVRLQQVQEQCYPVLPVSVMFHCLPVVMQGGYVLILPRQLGECPTSVWNCFGIVFV